VDDFWSARDFFIGSTSAAAILYSIVLSSGVLSSRPPAAARMSNITFFNFRSRLLQMLMAKSFAGRAIATMSAFERRAHRIYGGHS
jgi:hypothetical protein